MSDRDALRHMAMGDTGEEKRDPEKMDEREIAENILIRINQARDGNRLSSYEAKILSKLFRSALRGEGELDTEENRQMLGLISTSDGSMPAMVDPDKSPPYEESNKQLESERRLRSLSEFFDDLKAFKDDDEVPQVEKDAVHKKLQTMMSYYETVVDGQSTGEDGD